MNNSEIGNLFFDLKEFSIEEIYASWIRNVLIIVVSTLAVFTMINDCNGSCRIYHKIVIVFLLITSLLMLISSTIDYKKRMNNLYQNKKMPHIYNISMACVIIWTVLICFIVCYRFFT